MGPQRGRGVVGADLGLARHEEFQVRTALIRRHRFQDGELFVDELLQTGQKFRPVNQQGVAVKDEATDGQREVDAVGIRGRAGVPLDARRELYPMLHGVPDDRDQLGALETNGEFSSTNHSVSSLCRQSVLHRGATRQPFGTLPDFRQRLYSSP